MEKKGTGLLNASLAQEGKARDPREAPIIACSDIVTLGHRCGCDHQVVWPDEHPFHGKLRSQARMDASGHEIEGDHWKLSQQAFHKRFSVVPLRRCPCAVHTVEQLRRGDR